MDFAKPSDLKCFLENANIKLKKSLSQNFLVDKNVINKIVFLSNIQKDDVVIEIGPGLGVITKQLLKQNANVIAIEKDNFFAEILQKNITDEKLTVIHDDFLNVDLNDLIQNRKVKVVANIPYNISSLILKKLFLFHRHISTITLWLQKEFADRIIASYGSKDYGSLTVFTNFYSHPKYICTVSKNSFFPKPKIDSKIIQFTCKNKLDLETKKHIQLFEQFYRLAFQQRRKTLRSSLNKIIPKILLEKALDTLNIDKNIRPEDLSYEQFLQLFLIIHSEEISKCML